MSIVHTIAFVNKNLLFFNKLTKLSSIYILIQNKYIIDLVNNQLFFR